MSEDEPTTVVMAVSPDGETVSAMASELGIGQTGTTGAVSFFKMTDGGTLSTFLAAAHARHLPGETACGKFKKSTENPFVCMCGFIKAEHGASAIDSAV